MTTLRELTYKVARNLYVVREGSVTGSGTTTTLADSINLWQNDDYWNGGTVWGLYKATGGTLGVGIVTDFVQSTATLTFSAVPLAFATADRYAVCDKRLPYQNLIQFVNNALYQLGPMLLFDTSLTSATDKSEYNLPDEVAANLRQVHVAVNDDADDNQWMEVSNWDVRASDLTGPAKLILKDWWHDGFPIRLTYLGYHKDLTAYNSALSPLVDEKKVVDIATYEAARFLKATTGRKEWDEFLSGWQSKADLAAQKPYLPSRPGKIVQPPKNLVNVKLVRKG